MVLRGPAGFPLWIWPVGTTKSLSGKMIGPRPLGFAMPLARSSASCRGDQHCQSLLLYLEDIVVFSSTIAQHLEWLSEL